MHKDMWEIFDEYLYNSRENITVEDARLIYYFCDQVERFGYESSRIRCLLDCYLHFNHDAWLHIRKLDVKGAFNARS